MTSTTFILSSLLVLVVLLANSGVGVSAFKGSMVSRSRPTMVGTSTALFAAKKAAKKAATKKATAETFKKSEFIASVAEKTGMSKSDSEKALNAVLETITEEVVAGKRVSLVGFGTFQLRARAARKGRNPQTGEEIDIKASNSPGFSAAKAFKDMANP